MVHRRSKPELARREARRYLFTVSYRDQIQAETVSTIDIAVPTKVWRSDGNYSWDVTIVDKGDVLLDSRGRGTFQK